MQRLVMSVIRELSSLLRRCFSCFSVDSAPLIFSFSGGALSTAYRSLLWAVLLLLYTSLVRGSISSLPQSDQAVCSLKLQPRKCAAAASVGSHLPLLTLAHATLFWVHTAALIHSQVELHHRVMQECISNVSAVGGRV